MLVIEIGRQREGIRAGGFSGVSIGWSKSRQRREMRNKAGQDDLITINTT